MKVHFNSFLQSLNNQGNSSSDYTDFLPAALAIQKRPPSPTARKLLWAIVGLVVCSLLWFALSQIDIIVDAQGQVQADARLKVVQSYQKGTVEQLLVRDGDKVEKGQLLVVLDTDITLADVKSLEQQIDKLAKDVVRYNTLLRWLKQNATDNEADTLTQAMWASYQSNEQLLASSVAETQAQLATNKIQIEGLEQTLPFALERSRNAQTLLQKSFISKDEYHRLQQESITQQHQLKALRKTHQQLQASLAESRHRLASFQADFKRDQLNGVKEAIVQKSALEEQLTKAQALNAKQFIYSPVTGVVQELSIFTVGGVVTEAQPLMKVVPLDAPLEVIASIENSDIGFVEMGQEVTVKVNAFPFTEYGTITGKVVNISDAAVPTQDGRWLFTTHVLIEKNHLRIHGKKVYLRPGMDVMAEIKTGKRKLLQYFLSPIMKAMDESFEER